ncbi:MAG: MBL fold metallo-hydrolase [Thermodesulfobacteriota bacterium]|nr:MBL fold metallo-hydrolase [Thermodesulfobacteriota bacterium]
MKGVLRFSVLASGSSGNSCYVETACARVLVDAGLSCRETERRLHLVDVQPDSLDALIITHEHLDHIKGAGPLARRFDLPLFANLKTLEKGSKTLGNLPKPMIIRTGQTLTIGDLSVETFTKCHDAADPMGVVFFPTDGSSNSNGARVGLATDLGRSTRLVEDRLKDCQALIMEFNYDQEMLEDGPYPLDIKKRIKGPDGHLSNHKAGEILAAVYNPGLRHVVLAHLSEVNNHPEKARKEAAKVLRQCGSGEASIAVSRQDAPGPMIVP